MITRIILFLLFALSSSATLGLTQQDETLLTSGMDCYESKKLHCASEQFELALTNRASGMNLAQRNSIKKVLYSIYFRLAQEMVSNKSFSGVQSLCDKGIALGVELGLEEGVASRSFHIWYTIALLREKGTQEERKIADQLQRIQLTLSTASAGEQLSFLGESGQIKGADKGPILE